MKERILIFLIGLIFLLCSCQVENRSVADENKDKLIVIGFSQVGAESEWRVANTENMKAIFNEENGYELIYDDAKNKPENQIRAIRMFIQQEVDYIVFSPIIETGWDSILQEAKDVGIPVIIIDRNIELNNKELYIAFIGSDFLEEGNKAVEWLESTLENQGRDDDSINIVHIQGTIGSSAQIGRSTALEQAINRNLNWKIIAQECGDFTRAKTYEVMKEILSQTNDIDIVYCENDGEALGAIDAMEEAGLKCNVDDGVIVISFDATKLGLEYCLAGKIALNVECNPLQGSYVNDIIQKHLAGAEFAQKNYIEETQFDSLTITQDIIDKREY